METVQVSGEHVFDELARYRQEWRTTHRYPFIIGNDRDLENLRDMCEPPSDDGKEIIEQAMSFDIKTWLLEHAPKKKSAWPKKPLSPNSGILSVNDTLTGQRKPQIHIGFVESTCDWHVYAKLGYGGWNDCPAPHVHVALHKYWDEQYKTSLIYLSGDTVETLVKAPVTEKTKALALAEEQYGYCYDIVEQGMGTVGKLASSLLNSRYWYFWWD